MREYETTIIVQPEISEDGTAAIFERLDALLAESESIRIQCEDLGKRKLAYEIRRFHKGHYYILAYLSDGKVVPSIERALRLNDSILRFMTIQVSPEVADVEARKAEGAEAEAEQARKVAERVVREEEEAKARAEIERVAAEEAAAAAEKAAAEKAAAEQAAEVADSQADEAEGPAAASDEADADGDTTPAVDGDSSEEETA